MKAEGAGADGVGDSSGMEGTFGSEAGAVTDGGMLYGVRPCSGTEPSVNGTFTRRLMLPRGTTTTN